MTRRPMTVAQLIAELQKYPPDALVAYETDNTPCCATEAYFVPPESTYECLTAFANFEWQRQRGNFVCIS